MKARRTRHRRRGWPLIVLAVVAAFLLGFYLPRVVSILFSSLLEAIAPDSGGVELQISPGLRAGIGGVLALAATIGLLRPSRSEEAWRKGASAETRVGRILDSLGREGVRVIHDRKMPASRANIDHVAVTPAGVFTIDTKNYSGKLEVRGRGRQLWINGRNRSRLLEQAQGQAEAVRGVLALDYPDVSVHPVLLFVGTAVPLVFPPKEIGGVMIWTSRNVSRRFRRREPNQLSSDQVTSVAMVLDQRLR
jgi:hypothetical protein